MDFNDVGNFSSVAHLQRARKGAILPLLIPSINLEPGKKYSKLSSKSITSKLQIEQKIARLKVTSSLRQELQVIE